MLFRSLPVCVQVELELRAQVRLFEELIGHLPCHMDGHQHVHVLPGTLCVCGLRNKSNQNVFVLPFLHASMSQRASETACTLCVCGLHTSKAYREVSWSTYDASVRCLTVACPYIMGRPLLTSYLPHSVSLC